MTEKRFQYNVNKNTIEQNGKFVAYVNSVDGVRIANKLNVLQNENEQLKQSVSNLKDTIIKITIANEDLKEKLKSLDEIINNQIYEVKHTHKNCKKIGISELKKLKKVLICNNIIQDGDVE